MKAGKEWLLLMAGFLTASVAFGQQSGSSQDPSSGNTSAQTQGAGSATETTDLSNAPPLSAASQGSFARALNSASPLGGDNGPLQWGWVSVRSISFLEYFDTVSAANPGMPSASESLNASQLSTAIVVSHAFGTSHTNQFALQYTPSLLVTNGHVYTNTLNQTAGVDTTFQLTPRLGLKLSDRFTYYGSQRDFSGVSLDVNYAIGTSVTNNFLNGPGSVLDNTTSASVSYLLSPLTMITVSPSVGYQNQSGATNSQENVSAIYAGGTLNVAHALSASQTVGINYMSEYATYTGAATATTPQTNSNGVLQDLEVTYGKKIAATWRFNLGFGFSSNSGVDAQTGFAASAGISKSFNRMDFGVSYHRGHQFNGYITAGGTDRVDAVNTVRWSRRLTTNSSAAYFRSEGVGPSTSGFYATEQGSFRLTPSLSLTGGFAYTKQTGDGTLVVNGNSRLSSVGLTWSPATPPLY
jgi:hypothetical protein